MKKIIICGGGLTGLTVAHELIEKGFKVELYEQHNELGGMARSERTWEDVPTEHSWRGYAPFYYNTFELMKRIPIKQLCNNENIVEQFNSYTLEEIKKHNKEGDLWCYYKGDVYDITEFVNEHPGGKIILNAGGENLEEIWEKYNVDWHLSNDFVQSTLEKYKIGKIKEEYKGETVYDNLNKNRLTFHLFYDNLFRNPRLSIKDYIILVYVFSKVICSNKRKEEYFKISAEQILKRYLSKDGYHYLFDFGSGPGIGLDKKNCSLGHYGLFIEWQLKKYGISWQVMNQPTNEGWIDPWEIHLKSRGVDIHKNSSLSKINIKNNKIMNVEIIENGLKKEIEGDEYIMCIDPFRMEEILKKSKLDKLSSKYLNLNTINNQISFRVGFNRKINFNKQDAFVLIDSPYNITFYPQDIHWCSNVKLGLNIKSLWSGTCVLPYNRGLLYKKSALNLSIEELKEEIKYQLIKSKPFKEYIKKLNDNYILDEKDMLYIEIFNDWYENKNRLETKNKKWVNNIYNEEYRPKVEENPLMTNMYIGGSHTNTSINIWSMEGAIESGKYVSNQILSKYNKEQTYYYKHSSNILIELIKRMDDILYLLKLPNIIDLLLLYLLYKLLLKLKNKK